jgi:hypothetical protein
MLPLPAVAAHKSFYVRQLQVTSEVLSPKLEGTQLASVALECSHRTLATAAAQVGGCSPHMTHVLNLAPCHPTPRLRPAFDCLPGCLTASNARGWKVCQTSGQMTVHGS